MWAMGAIMAELLMLRLSYPGKNASDQTSLMCRVLGSPTMESWPEDLLWRRVGTINSHNFRNYFVFFEFRRFIFSLYFNSMDLEGKERAAKIIFSIIIICSNTPPTPYDDRQEIDRTISESSSSATRFHPASKDAIQRLEKVRFDLDDQCVYVLRGILNLYRLCRCHMGICIIESVLSMPI
ncbi:hypothetical protein QYF36_024350 [Acer negundo]|nr:hypothetical protein QYF36_024350 [Acer negundo]